MRILHKGKGRFVLGSEYSRWHQPDEVLPLISGQTDDVDDPDFGWELLRSPLPVVNSTDEPRARRLFSAIRQDLGLNERQTEGADYFLFVKGNQGELKREIAEKFGDFSPWRVDTGKYRRLRHLWQRIRGRGTEW